MLQVNVAEPVLPLVLVTDLVDPWAVAVGLPEQVIPLAVQLTDPVPQLAGGAVQVAFDWLYWFVCALQVAVTVPWLVPVAVTLAPVLWLIVPVVPEQLRPLCDQVMA